MSYAVALVVICCLSTIGLAFWAIIKIADIQAEDKAIEAALDDYLGIEWFDCVEGEIPDMPED